MKDLNRRTFMKCMAAAATTVVVGQNVSSASALNSSIIGRLNSADGAYAEQLAFEITSDFKNLQRTSFHRCLDSERAT